MTRNKTRPVASAVVAALLLAVPAQASGGLQLMPDLPLLLILLVAFVVLIAPVNHLIFRPLFAVLDEREAKIAGARHRAETLGRDAEVAIARYQDAVRDVHEESERERRRQLDDARAEHAAATAQARVEAERQAAAGHRALEEALEEARSGLRQQASDLAQAIASRVLGRSLS